MHEEYEQQSIDLSPEILDGMENEPLQDLRH